MVGLTETWRPTVPQQLLDRAHREKKSFVDFGKVDETILSVECARRFVFSIYNDSR